MRAFGVAVSDPIFEGAGPALVKILRKRPELKDIRSHGHYSWEQLCWVFVFVDPTNSCEFIPLQSNPLDMIPSCVLDDPTEPYRPKNREVKFAPEKSRRYAGIILE